MEPANDPFGDGVSQKRPAESEDVFSLTGTTFAPSETRDGGLDDGHDTRTNFHLEGLAEVAEGEGDGDSQSSTARHNRLLEEAEMRAEHQAQARATMLDLAKALDASNAKARELAEKLRAEYDANVKLRGQNEFLSEEVEKLVRFEEDRQAKALLDKAMASNNKMFFNMLLEKSRDREEWRPAFVMDDVPTPAQLAEVQEASANAESDAQPSVTTIISSVAMKAQLTTASNLSDILSNSVGDKVTLSWVMRLWYKEVELTKIRKEQARLEEEKRLKAEEEARRIREEREKAVAEIKKQVKDLEAQLDRARTIINGHQEAMDKIQKELKEAQEKAAREAAAAKAREEQLKAELAKTKQELEKTQNLLADLQADYEASQEALRKADEAFAAERQKLQGIIRQVNSELHEAMILAKHMRETALKAKRDAAGSVSPQKFAELIAQLERMKADLSQYARDCAEEKEKNGLLLRKLDKNQRQLELERQFLPLLRKVRGPVGPQSQEETNKRSKADATQMAMQAAMQSMMPALAGPGNSPAKLRMSQSAGAFFDTRGAAGPGGRSTGFQDDQTRFASSLGFAGSGQGTPLRG